MSYCHPFQKLCYISQSGGNGLLLAAAGPQILSFDLTNGGILSRWPNDAARPNVRPGSEKSTNGDVLARSVDDDPPTKRRKTSPSQEEEQDSRESSVSVKFVSERAKGQRRKKKEVVQSPLPNVSHILSTADRRHVVVVTAEDKCIRVFELLAPGFLKLLSERCMPKRLCAIALTRNQTSILVGDKFGDVYSSPLHLSFKPSALSPSKPQLEIPKLLRPSASEFTVHTKGNREALRQQQLQKVSAPKKQAPAFEHQLILGHVSLLTDLVVGSDASQNSREYILTADRDEHIRVSRGIPQAHIINNYCLGHTEFVSRLCVLPERPRFLVSGGGEPSIRIYDWLRGTTVAEANLDEDLKQIAGNSAFDRVLESDEKRAVSCLRACHIGGIDGLEDVILIMVALEGTPCISTYRFYPGSRLLKQDKRYSLDANVLDIVLIKEGSCMLVSLDNFHCPLSTKQRMSHPCRPIIRLFELRVGSGDGEGQYDWIQHNPLGKGDEKVQKSSFDDIASKLEGILQSEDVRHEIEVEEAVKPKVLSSPLGESLYGLENLRKKSQGDGEGQHVEERAADNPEEP